MRKDGAGQRWGLIEWELLKQHDLARLRTGSVALEQTFQRPGEKPFTIRLTFLSSRPELARVLANAFWIVHQNGKRRATLIASAHSLRLSRRSGGQRTLRKGPSSSGVHRFQHLFFFRNAHRQNASLLISIDIKKFAKGRINRSHGIAQFVEPIAPKLL